MKQQKKIPADFSRIFILTMVGGVLILIDGLLNAFLNAPSGAYASVFPFLSDSQIHVLLSLGGLFSGAAILVGTFIVIFSARAFSLLKKHRVVVSIVAVVLDVIGFPVGGGFIIGFVMVLVCSAWLIVLSTQWVSGRYEGRRPQSPEIKIPNAGRGLSREEKIIWSILRKNKGAVLQSRLVQESGFSKVKITRILNLLETRDLIERKRMGMSNLVVAKRQSRN